MQLYSSTKFNVICLVAIKFRWPKIVIIVWGAETRSNTSWNVCTNSSIMSRTMLFRFQFILRIKVKTINVDVSIWNFNSWSSWIYRVRISFRELPEFFHHMWRLWDSPLGKLVRYRLTHFLLIKTTFISFFLRSHLPSVITLQFTWTTWRSSSVYITTMHHSFPSSIGLCRSHLTSRWGGTINLAVRNTTRHITPSAIKRVPPSSKVDFYLKRNFEMAELCIKHNCNTMQFLIQ